MGDSSQGQVAHGQALDLGERRGEMGRLPEQLLLECSLRCSGVCFQGIMGREA